MKTSTLRKSILQCLGVAIDPTCINVGRLERTEPNLYILNGRWLERTKPNLIQLKWCSRVNRHSLCKISSHKCFLIENFHAVIRLKSVMIYRRVSVIRLSVAGPTRLYVQLTNWYSLIKNTLHGVRRKVNFTYTSLSVLRPNFLVPTWTYNRDSTANLYAFLRHISVWCV